MHQGQLAGPPSLTTANKHNAPQKVPDIASPPGPNPNASSLDDLLSGAAKDADRAAATAENKIETPKAQEPQEEKKGKKDRDKSMKLMYSDNEVSPEEKMAKMPRYAFAPSG